MAIGAPSVGVVAFVHGGAVVGVVTDAYPTGVQAFGQTDEALAERLPGRG